MTPTINQPISNILIVKLSAIGDVVHALPVAHALKQCYPHAKITWIVEKPAFDLVNNNPDIDEVIIFDKPKFKSLKGLLFEAPPFVRQLRERKFDLALDLQAIFKGAIIAFLSGAPKRLVYCNTREMSHWLSERVIGENADGHVVERYLDVVRALGCKVDKTVFSIHITETEANSAEAIAEQAGLNLAQPYVVLSPGANWPNKRWPVLYFTALADKLYNDGIIPVISGGPGDKTMAKEIIANAAVPPIDLTGKTSLKQLSHIIKKARAFVGGDTGPMHLAAALATPVVAVYGPTDTKRNGPYGDKNISLVAAWDCAGCWSRSCPKGRDCLENIDVEAVYKAVRGVINGIG